VEHRKTRAAVGGLRKADPTTLAVLTQDVLRLPLGQVERGTLLDLFALSEVPDQLPFDLGRDLGRWREQMIREIGDLPDGPPLAEFARELSTLEAGRASNTLRQAVSNLKHDCVNADAIDAIEGLVDHWESAPASIVDLPRGASPDAAGKKTGAGKTKRTVLKPKGAPKTAKTPAAEVDTRREAWIEEDALSRLANYGSRGLKESIVVAGARHRSPWSDLTEAEVLTTLRRMKRESKVRFSAGRWMVST
jgi:hypothetical protein